ncbi:restriction endonuclease subunit S [Proteus mirabilis]|uniref:restriction endonuclease subunit S n=1 Tax=Proteus mirabilis TaxID=584 RepID=UPI0021BA5DC9|nr:restriction endonuclease subunit S [Proteus mirabilis]MCT8222867.1 restriction endonuclease subunit S [Proteus mirabilis]HEK2012432.1 restriction endonuclease subunit S [Proteus mirabilis]
MGSEWITYSVDEIATVKSGKRLPKDESLTDKKTSYPYIRLVDVNQGKIDSSKIQYLEPKTQNKISRYIVEANDVCLAIVGHTIGMVFYVEDEWNSANLTENAARLTDISSSFNPRYIYYYLISPVGQSEIISRKVGSAQGKLPLYNIKELKIKAPDRITQDHIVDVLLSLDNKITLNRQINQTLEQMAQTLFKSWFVDFDPVVDNALDVGFFEQDLAFSDELLRRVEVRKAVRESDNFKPLSEDIRRLFPNAFEECAESALGLGGWVPKGWGSSPVGSLIELIGGGTPKTSESSYWGGDIPWFSVVDAPNDSDVFVMDTEKKITELGIQNSSAKILKVGTTIISARGTVGKCALVAKPMAINQSCYGIVGKNGIHDYFTYYLIRHSVSHLQQRSHGSVFSTITRDTFNSFNFIFSGDLIANAFGETISFWFEKIARNNQQNYILQKLRDTLLPKLISGELSLSDIKIDIPEETLI